MAQEQKHPFPVRLRFVVLFVILLTLLLAAVGTLAWMRHIRSLQTATLVQVTDLTLEGPNATTAAIELGDIDVETEPYSQSYVFGVKSVNITNCTIQLAHTTNIPFRYNVYKAKTDSIEGDFVSVGADNFYYGDPLTGKYLNQSESDERIAKYDDDYYKNTYVGVSLNNVQKNAMPLYWQAETTIEENKTSYFILKVTWDSGLKNTKETDMVYLTVGTGGTGETGGN